MSGIYVKRVVVVAAAFAASFVLTAETKPNLLSG